MSLFLGGDNYSGKINGNGCMNKHERWIITGVYVSFSFAVKRLDPNGPILKDAWSYHWLDDVEKYLLLMLQSNLIPNLSTIGWKTCKE